MKTASNLIRLTNNLTAHWSESVLQMLKAAGVEYLSVETEIDAWHTLRKVLLSELLGEQAFRRSTLESLSALMERVLRRSAERVAARIHAVTPQFQKEMRRLAGERVATPAERSLYERIIREPEVRAAFKETSRTDFLPHLRVSSVVS